MAFALTEWSQRKGERLSETKILMEINNGINADLNDFQANMNGHTISLRAISFMRGWLDGNPGSQDSTGIFYNLLFRNFTPIIHTSGYESLKATNIKTITNDSLRFQLINLYDYYYTILEKLEDQVAEMQDFKNFFASTNEILSPYMVFNAEGGLVQLNAPTGLSKEKKQLLLSYFWKVENNKKFKLFRYSNVVEEIRKLSANIERELKQR